LDTPQKARPNAASSSLGEGFLVAILKVLAGSEISGNEKIEERPQVAYGIL
jgi:hypothetical protein